MPGSLCTRPRCAAPKTSRIAAARSAPDEFPWARRPGSASNASWRALRRKTPVPPAESEDHGRRRARWTEPFPKSSCGRKPSAFRWPSVQGSAFRGIFAVMLRRMQMHGVVFGVVGEELGVAAPVQRRFNLLFDFHLGEALVEQVTEKLYRHRVIRFLLQRGLNLLQQRNVRQHRFAKQYFSRRYVCLRECEPVLRDAHIAFMHRRE